MKKKQPWMKFYPSDWLGDAALQSCSIAAQGMWMKMLCIMHQTEPIGYLKTGDLVMQTDQLLAALSLTKRKYERLLQELHIADVFSRENGSNCMYSRRMVHDARISALRKAVGKRGGNPALVNLPPAPAIQKPDAREDGKKKVPKKSQSFVPPTEEEVSRYCQQKGYQIDAPKFIDYYQARGWMLSKTKMKDWQATIRGWIRRDKEREAASGPKQAKGGLN